MDNKGREVSYSAPGAHQQVVISLHVLLIRSLLFILIRVSHA